MTPPLVSVVMPCFNAGERLDRSLGSCFEQQWSALQIIVVDNNSTDGSAARAQRLAAKAGVPIELVGCAEQGVAHALNEGYRHVRGDFVQWLDSDDEIHPDKIATQVAALQAAPDADIGFGDWRWCFDTHGAPPACYEFRDGPHRDMLLSLLANHWRSLNSYLLRRTAAVRLLEAGAWSTTTAWGNDREYFTLAALLGLRFVHTPGALSRYNSWSSTQMTVQVSAGERQRALRAIFAGLREQAAERASVALDERHQRLLRRDFTFWRAAPADPMRREVAGADGALLALLGRSGWSRSIADLAARLARALWRQLGVEMGATPSTAPLRLARLRAFLGLHAAVTHIDLQRLTPLLQGEPPVLAPVLVAERLHIETRLETLAVGGRLLRVEDPA